MISSQWKFGKDVAEIVALREKCGFGQADTDEKSLHLLLLEDNVPVACGSLYFDKGAYRIGSLCVIKESRGKHIGDLAMRMLSVKGFNMLAEKIVITATEETVPFFERYGFVQKENLIMEVDPQSFKLESKCGHKCEECLNPCK